MSENAKQVYGPLTLECSKFGRLTRFFLWFLPTYIYENGCTIMIYKKWRGTMFVMGLAHKEHPPLEQHQKPWES